ncbi:MAG: YbaB/EbfC family nucleoid-associated protein [Clostridia bacterium]|nr:YbaB/EbfC family nucleoid-associated protein [Clostridia bacterium]
MKVRLPKNGSGMNNIQALAKQAQEAQEQMEKASKELEEKEYSASSGGEAVKVTISGKLEVKNIDIKPEVVDPEDVSMLSDLIIAAINEALRTATQEKEDMMQSISGQMHIPGLF